MLSRRDLVRAGWAATGIAGISAIGITPAAGNTPATKRVSQLSEIVPEHGKWLNDPRTGKRAILAGLDLTGIRLHNLSLMSADLTGVILRDAVLENVALTRASLIEADLGGAQLIRCDLLGVDFTSASLPGATIQSFFTDEEGDKMTRADEICFRHANLENATIRFGIDRADFSNSNLAGVDFRESILDGDIGGSVNFSGSILDGANFEGMHISFASFDRTSIKGGNFAGCTIICCDFDDSDLSGVSMAGASVLSSNFRRAKWAAADLRQTDFEQCRHTDGYAQPSL